MAMDPTKYHLPFGRNVCGSHLPLRIQEAEAFDLEANVWPELSGVCVVCH